MKWEYKILTTYPVLEDCVHQLNSLGAQGWELVAIVHNKAYFKRVLGGQ